MAGPLPITGVPGPAPQAPPPVPPAGNAPSVAIEQLHNFSLAEFIQALIDARAGTEPLVVTGPDGDTLEFSPEALQTPAADAAPLPLADLAPPVGGNVDVLA